jgi:hypothetical protein
VGVGESLAIIGFFLSAWCFVLGSDRLEPSDEPRNAVARGRWKAARWLKWACLAVGVFGVFVAVVAAL